MYPPRATSNCIHTVAKAICDNMHRFIRWPDEQESRLCKLDFYQNEGWPSIVGLIDGTQIPLYTPFHPADEAVYVNRKGFHAINVQIVCDRNLKIFNLDAGFPESCHDAYILLIFLMYGKDLKVITCQTVGYLGTLGTLSKAGPLHRSSIRQTKHRKATIQDTNRSVQLLKDAMVY